MKTGMETIKRTSRPRQEQKKHGYTKAQKFAIEQKVKLVARIQHHMLQTYIKYINNPLVKEDAEKHKNIKGTKTEAIGRPSMMPEQLGHE
eukprot:5659262-Heterocapsa_arctica.AAC.1